VRDIVICEPLRTPIGRFGGSLRSVTAAQLGVTVVAALLARLNIDPSSIDDVILGQCYPNGEAPAIGRVVALDAGLPVTTPGAQVDRRCGSGLQAIINAVMQVASGSCDTVIAGGVESMSQVEYYALGLRSTPGPVVQLNDRLSRARQTPGGGRYPVEGGMIETAENVRRQYGISRAEQDEFALRSHERAVAAQTDGRFDDEIVPVRVSDAVEVAVDEHPRSGSTIESLEKLRAIRRGIDDASTVTAGNSSGQNDGAAVCLVTTRENADRIGAKIMARLRSWSVAGVEPKLMGMGPVPATAKALKLAELSLADLDLLELNEAFAAQVLGCTREWGFTTTDFDRLNVNGSGISLGHPVGATGGRIFATGLRELERRGGQYFLETMCIGGGQGLAAIFERVAV
jgi:acetyl-CoA C-acetyltransferase